MEVRVHGIRMTVGDELRALAEDKVAHAARIFDEVATADVEFTEEQNPRLAAEKYRVEITSTAAGQTIRVEAAEFDDRAALEVATDIFERQLRRLKERLIDRSRQPGEKHLNGPSGSVEEQEDDELRIDRVKRFDVKPMSPEEAALQMELLGHSFFLFFNAESEKYSVLYRRRGGSLGLIEPQ